MTDKYRVTVPELVIDVDPQTRAETVHSVNTVLWRGDALPDGQVIDALLEGQVEQRAQRAGSGNRVAQSHGHHLFIERRRRVLLGWAAVDVVNIPGA